MTTDLLVTSQGLYIVPGHIVSIARREAGYITPESTHITMVNGEKFSLSFSIAELTSYMSGQCTLSEINVMRDKRFGPQDKTRAFNRKNSTPQDSKE